MKWYTVVFFVFIINFLGCSHSNTKVVVPSGSSKDLDVRSDEYKRTMAKYSVDKKQGNHSSENLLKKNSVSPDQVYNPFMDIKSLPDITKERRMALVIGNSNYINGGSLPNPTNDAKAIAKSLQNLGFTVVKIEDANQIEMKKVIDRFGNDLIGYDVGLFFYAGHGLQVNGNNYLIPVEADINSESDVEYNCVNAGRVLGKMEGASCKTNIVILDACRDNPFKRSWSRDIKLYSKGLAFMNAPSGSLIAYSTSPGKIALDGEAGKNGVYTSALLQHLQTPNITIEEMFKRVRVTVEKITNKRQVPWESTSLKGNFVFKVKK